VASKSGTVSQLQQWQDEAEQQLLGCFPMCGGVERSYLHIQTWIACVAFG
jgi:hypothetical protein